MALLSTFGRPVVFRVSQSSTDSSFVHWNLEDTSGVVRIEAKQLYEGKRYVLQRLLVGRFTDFWKRNEEIIIQGTMTTIPPPNEFAIEPLDPKRLQEFWTLYVKREDGRSPGDLLAEIDFSFPDLQ